MSNSMLLECLETLDVLIEELAANRAISLDSLQRRMVRRRAECDQELAAVRDIIVADFIEQQRARSISGG